MKVENFVAGKYLKQYQYECFVPETINRPWTWEDAKVNTLLEQARGALAELNAFSFIVPDVDLFTQMHIIKEANQSSKIEGTETSLDEALMDRELIDPERRDDWQEVQNYIRAMHEALDQLGTLPLSNRLLRNTHAILLEGVRGEHKSPGEFRASQNWIGDGRNLRDAIFIPPSHEYVPDLMSDLEKFWHNEEIEVPHLIRIALSHYQFETVHPFQDGNGRIGRLLVTLYLIDKGMLVKPSLYLSDYLERHRATYYDSLTLVREKNDLLQWIRFFLTALRETAIKGKSTFQKILELRQDVEKRVIGLKRKAHHARQLLSFLYRKPVASINDIAEHLHVSHQTANALVADFERLKILRELTGYKRNRQFGFVEYYMLFFE